MPDSHPSGPQMRCFSGLRKSFLRQGSPGDQRHRKVLGTAAKSGRHFELNTEKAFGR